MPKWSAQQCCWISSWDVHNDSQHVSTMCSPRWCTISVHQGWSRRPRCQVPSWSSIRFQSGKYEDQVGQQQKQWCQENYFPAKIILSVMFILVEWINMVWSVFKRIKKREVPSLGFPLMILLQSSFLVFFAMCKWYSPVIKLPMPHPTKNGLMSKTKMFVKNRIASTRKRIPSPR